MRHVSSRGCWFRRVPTWAGVAFLFGCLICQPGSARDPKDAKQIKNGSRSSTGKGSVPLPPPPFITHAGVSKDVPEMVKVINAQVQEKWKENNVAPAPYASDYEFIRRASLDIIGRIAKPREIDEFFRDPRETRRSKLIDRLLGHEDYARHWSDLWANWLLSRAGIFGRGGSNSYHGQMQLWLAEQFSLNRPYNAIIEDLLTASGSNKDNPAVNFILAHTGEMVPQGKRSEEGQFEMVPLTSRVTRLFLGTQVQCCQCHDHPFQAALKQNHFWGVNAFLRQVERAGTPPMEGRRGMTYATLTLRDNPSANSDAAVFYEKRNGVVLQTKAEFLPVGEEKRGPRLPANVGQDPRPNARRHELANFVQNHENFPRAIVNRMWGVFLGRGFVNPIDDFNDQNQPSHPELLGELATHFKHYNYDLKKLIRWICNSVPYNLSYAANKTNDKQEQEVLFSRMLLKSMTPEQLFKTATDPDGATGKNDKAKAREEWLSNLVANFGDDEGNEVNFNGTVVQALMMMNGRELNEAISRKPGGTVAMAIARHGRFGGGRVIHDLYMAALNRPPTANEMQTIQARMPLRYQFRVLDVRDPAGPYQDLFWALLNSNEFLLNH